MVYRIEYIPFPYNMWQELRIRWMPLLLGDKGKCGGKITEKRRARKRGFDGLMETFKGLLSFKGDRVDLPLSAYYFFCRKEEIAL